MWLEHRTGSGRALFKCLYGGHASAPVRHRAELRDIDKAQPMHLRHLLFRKSRGYNHIPRQQCIAQVSIVAKHVGMSLSARLRRLHTSPA
jgi:hypothetical protein